MLRLSSLRISLYGMDKKTRLLRNKNSCILYMWQGFGNFTTKHNINVYIIDDNMQQQQQ